MPGGKGKGRGGKGKSNLGKEGGKEAEKKVLSRLIRILNFNKQVVG